MPSLRNDDDSGSGSDIEGSSKSSSSSAADSPQRSPGNSPAHSGSPGSPTPSGSPGSPNSRRSRSSSPRKQQKDNKSADSKKRSVSPEKSGNERSPSVSPQRRSPSGSPQHSPKDRRTDGNRSRSGSAKSARSRSKSAGSNRSRSGSARSNHSSRSGSAKSVRSRSKSAGSNRSRSGSAKSNRSSRSGSAKSNRSRSGSAKSNRSRSGSAKSKRSRSPSAHSNRSGSVSPHKSRSPSASPKRSRRGSGSPRRSRSGSVEAKGHSSRRSSHGSNRSGSASARSRSGSRTSVKSGASVKSGDEFGTERKAKRKRAVLSDESGSDGDSKAKPQKKPTTSRGSGEESGDDNLVIDAEALFGDASDISSDEEGKRKAKKLSDDEEGPAKEERPRKEESDAESERAKSGDEDKVERDEDQEGEDKENVPDEPIPETRIEVEIPKITTNLGKEMHFVKLPNFLSVETRPFDGDTYEDEIDEEETLDEEGRARLKLKVENTIRWREYSGPKGETKQSNGRFVRWSDGSMSLHLGSEIFDVYKQPLQGDHNHMFIRQGTGLQGQAVFRTKLTFRPHSTESFTHRKMTISLADRSLKTSGIKVLSLVGKDPEANRGELIKKEEERLRASMRRESKQKRVREKGASRGLSASYLEPDRYGDMDSDEEGISISAIKKQHKNKVPGKAANIYSSDEDASDIETRRARRLDKAKALKDSDSEDSGDGNASGGSDNEQDDD